MKEPICYGMDREGREHFTPFSLLSDSELAWCATPNLSWHPEPDDLPDYQSIYCSIAARYLAERTR